MAVNVLGLAQYVQQQGDIGRQNGIEQARAKTLSQYMAPAMGGDAAATAKIAGIDPTAAMNAQAHAGQMKESAAKQLQQYAKWMLAAPESMRQQMYPQMAAIARDAGFPVPEQLSPDMLPMFEKLAGAGQSDPRIVAPGSALVGNDGKVIYERPFAPARPSLVYSDQGQPYWATPGQGLQPAQVGDGMPAPTGGADVMGGALDEVVGSIVGPLGGRITSTTGGKHNPGSKHYSGNAIDVGMGRESPEKQAQLMAALQAVPNLKVVDERQRPAGQKEWSGPHLHAEWAQGGPSFGGKAKQSAIEARQKMIADLEAAGVRLTPEQRSSMLMTGKPQDARPGKGGLSAGEAAKVRTNLKETKDALNAFQMLDQALKDTPNDINLVTDGEARGRLGTAYNNARSSLRILYNTGVLQPGELPMLEKALRDPTTTTAIIDPRTRPQLRAQLDELYRLAQRNIENQVESYPQIFNQQVFKDEMAKRTGSGKYRVGQVIEQGGKRYRVTDVSDPNDPDVEEI